MATEYFDSSLNDVQIEAALTAISRVQKQQNNGKIVGIVNGELSVIDGSTVRLEELNAEENGVFYPSPGFDGFSKVVVQVSSGQRSPRCDQVVTFDWGEAQKHMAWNEGTPQPY